MDTAEQKKVLETEGLTKSYGKARGIVDVSLDVRQGEIFGFIGPNGAGKSTTIRTILGLLFPDSGSIRLFGEDAVSNGARLRKKIGFVPSEINYYENLSVGALLKYSSDIFGLDSRRESAEYCERLKLDQNRKIVDLSLGNRKKVGLVQALLHNPELLILDEPTSGLDPLIQSRYYEILREQQQRGCTIFFSSHTLSEVERLCSRVAIIREGRIVNVSAIEQLRKLYLKRFRITAENPHGIQPEQLSFAREIKISSAGAEGLYSGDVKKLMNKLAQLPIDDVVIEDPNLEEIFMHYYNNEGGAEL